MPRSRSRDRRENETTERALEGEEQRRSALLSDANPMTVSDSGIGEQRQLGGGKVQLSNLHCSKARSPEKNGPGFYG